VAAMPLKREDLNQQLDLKTTQSQLLKIEQLRVLSDTLNTNPEALSAFLVLMTERHERAGINSRQALEISRKDGTISKLQKTILNFENSEIWKLGQSIWNALQKKGKERSTELAQNGVVHKDDYNQAVTELKNTIDEQKQGIQQQTSQASTTIHDLENTNDSLRKQLTFIQNYITNNYGLNNWHQINNYVQSHINKGS
jgi:gas vesicle protein